MNFLTDDVKKLYNKYLVASLGSALVMSVYSFVDMIAVGQSEGPAGFSAMAVITPLYGMIVFFILSKRCRLKFVKPFDMRHSIRNIFTIGFGAGVLELGTVTIAIMMNNQVMRYGGTTELAVYGAVASVGALFQALFGGVGQAIQPLVPQITALEIQGAYRVFGKCPSPQC